MLVMKFAEVYSKLLAFIKFFIRNVLAMYGDNTILQVHREKDGMITLKN
jgi:hypothetical protein